MRKLILILMVFFASHALLAQTEAYNTAINNFQEAYNSEKFDGIFRSFSAEMQQNLPIEKTRQFLIDLKSQVGKMESTEFIGYEQISYATYKTVFERAAFAVNISLNENNQIN